MSLCPDPNRPARLRESLVEVLVQRLDEANVNGRLSFLPATYVTLLEVLFPEHYYDCPIPSAAAFDSLPGTPARAALHHARARSGQGLRHPRDRTWDESLAITPEREVLPLTTAAHPPPKPVAPQGQYLWRVTFPDGRVFEVWADSKTAARDRCRELGYSWRNEIKVQFDLIRSRDEPSGRDE